MKDRNKPTKADQEFLEAYEQNGFTNAVQTYQKLHPDVSYQTAANRAHNIKKKHADYLTERYEAIAGKSLERAARYVTRMEQHFFDPECKSTALSTIGRTLLLTTGVLDGSVSGSGEKVPSWVKELDENTKE